METRIRKLTLGRQTRGSCELFRQERGSLVLGQSPSKEPVEDSSSDPDKGNVEEYSEEAWSNMAASIEAWMPVIF